MNIIGDAVNLSSGTLATLTEKRVYEELDAIQAEFIGFVIKHPGQYDNWMKAWNAFTAQAQKAADFSLNRRAEPEAE